jgi:hypothetical protein
MRSSPCRSCGKFIVFAKDVRGKWLLLNEDPVGAKGDYVLTWDEDPKTPTAVRYATLSPVEAVAFRDRFEPHWNTCAARRKAGT